MDMTNAHPTLPDPLCGHSNAHLHTRGSYAVCGLCGSLWDLDYCLDQAFEYNTDYSSQRNHFSEAVAQCKVSTLRYWLNVSGIDLKNKAVLEVGFGGGSCLLHVDEYARAAYGIEAQQASLDFVEQA